MGLFISNATQCRSPGEFKLLSRPFLPKVGSPTNNIGGKSRISDLIADPLNQNLHLSKIPGPFACALEFEKHCPGSELLKE